MTDPTTSSAVASSVTNWLMILLAPVAAFVSAQIIMLLQKLLQHWGIQVSNAQQAQLEAVTKSAVLKAEEMGAQQAGVGAAAVVNKLQMATQDIVTKLPATTQVQAEDAIHAMLPQLGLGAAIQTVPPVPPVVAPAPVVPPVVVPAVPVH